MFGVATLVAKTFIPNKNMNLQVDHKDGNKENNKVSNLEWVTAKENVQRAHDTGLCKEAEEKGAFEIKVEKDNKVQYFPSIRQASIQLGISRDTICDKMKKNISYKGYTFMRIN
jgi:hypothetical protein